MKQKMTLTEGLAKLKLYDSKIRKQLRELTYGGNVVDFVVGSETKGVITGKTADELKKDAEAKVQKTLALINNRNKLKAIIAQTNAVTKVNINDKEYTIAQAIERKRGLENEKEFIAQLEGQVVNVKNKVSQLNVKAQEKANQIVEAQVQSEAKNKKTEEIEALYNLIYNKNKAEMIDPLNIEKLVEDMKNEIEQFEQNVDVALSIVNAKTEIEVDFDEE
jgi:hypothetical protein